MCGITGFNWNDNNLIKKLVKTLEHRGPDGHGHYTDKNISLGHTRLSIIDLSNAGKQPMSNSEGSIWITFNGEIYNYKEQRDLLEKKGYKFKSNTDTEVIIKLYEEYGINFVNYLRGMFALVIWDSNLKKIILTRDQLGVKPLYYLFDNGNLIFSSEIKTFKAIKEIKLEINKESLMKLLAYRYTPDENTMFKNIKKVLPGQIITIENNEMKINTYYDQKENIIYNNLAGAIKKADEIISDSIKKHMIADVEVGSFLSGGIDSSIISSISQKYMKEQGRSLKTFSVGFDYFSELKYAKETAEHIGSDHNELIIDSNTAIKTIPKLIWQNDEPLTDFAAIPYYLLSKFAKKKVKVVVAGQGGDELFGGYHHYKKMVNTLKVGRYMPKNIKNMKISIPQRKIQRAFELLSISKDISKVYSDAYFVFKEKELKELFSIKSDMLLYPIKSRCNNNIKKELNKILYIDQKMLLSEYFNMVVDKHTMANALEERVPYLDKVVADFSFNLNTNLKINGNREKIILKSLGKRLLPDNIIKRKKQGYGVPYFSWINSELGEIITSDMENSEIAKNNIIKKEFIKNTINKIKDSQTTAMRGWMIYAVEKWYNEFIVN